MIFGGSVRKEERASSRPPKAALAVTIRRTWWGAGHEKEKGCRPGGIGRQPPIGPSG